jgi:hypothetical protein
MNVFFFVHFFATIVIWTHFALIKFEQQGEKVPEGAPRYWLKRVVRFLGRWSFGCMRLAKTTTTTTTRYPCVSPSHILFFCAVVFCVVRRHRLLNLVSKYCKLDSKKNTCFTPKTISDETCPIVSCCFQFYLVDRFHARYLISDGVNPNHNVSVLYCSIG